MKNSSNGNNHKLDRAKPSQIEELLSNYCQMKNSSNGNNHQLNRAKPRQIDEVFGKLLSNENFVNSQKSSDKLDKTTFWEIILK